MKFQEKQRVRMKRTENYGTVTALLPNNLIQVKFDDGMGHMALPAEALESAAEPEPKRATVKDSGAMFAATGHRDDRPAPPRPAADPIPERAAQEGGVALAFDPQLDNEANPVAYEVYLLNRSPHKIVYELKVFTGSNRRWSKSGMLDGRAKKRLDIVEYRWLNEKLICELDVRTVQATGTGPRNFERMRIQGKTFFSKLQDVPELYRDAHFFAVFNTLASSSTAAPAAAPRGPSLRAITKAEALKRPVQKVTRQRTIETDLAEKLTFPQTIDLHIDRVIKDPTSVPRHMYLQLQLKAFDEYIDKAVRLGVDNVFIIHGVGDGVLKRAIHSRLHRVKYVRDFKNEHHPKFGYGATEVIFD